jgi:large subunit ribosomal protein L4
MASPSIETVTGTFSVPVFNRQGQEVGTVTVDAADFGGKISPRLMHEAVLMYETNKRQGTHSTLRRGEVAGSTKKLFRQKGTGNARVGTRRTAKRRGGGTAKGPKPRDYTYALPKQSLRIATRMAVLSKIRDNAAIVLDDFGLTAIKTKDVAGILKVLNLREVRTPVAAPAEPLPEGQTPPKPKKKNLSLLIGTETLDPLVHKSARNLEGVRVLPASDFNAYEVLRPKKLVLTRGALEALRAKKE